MKINKAISPLLILPFIVLAYFVKNNLTDHLDLSITSFIQTSHPSLIMDTFMRFISDIGYISVMSLIVMFVCIHLYTKKEKRAAVTIALSMLLVLFANILLKNYFNRPRPTNYEAVVYIPHTDPSFPSGHTTTYVVFYGFLIYLVNKNLERHHFRFPLLLILYTPILTVGISRIYLGAHWFSDVLAGYLFGFWWLHYTIGLYKSKYFNNGKR